MAILLLGIAVGAEVQQGCIEHENSALLEPQQKVRREAFRWRAIFAYQWARLVLLSQPCAANVAL